MSERITTRCPGCHARFHVRAEQSGRTAKCPKCGSVFVVVAEGGRSSEPKLDDLAALAGGTIDESAPAMPPPAPPARSTGGPSRADHVGGGSRVPATSQRSGNPAKQFSTRRIVFGVLGLGVIAAAAVIVPHAIEIRRTQLETAEQFHKMAEGLEQMRRGAPPPLPRPRVSAEVVDVWSEPKIEGRVPPPLTPRLEGKFRVAEATVSLRTPGTRIRLVMPKTEARPGTMPCAFICPAGSNLLTGVAFDEGEQSDYDTLVETGIAVCFYSLDGVPQPGSGPDELQRSMSAYIASRGGLNNLQDAIDAVLAGVPEINEHQLATVGHSSAGTVALIGAAHEPRIDYVAVMAPVTDLTARVEPSLFDEKVIAFADRMSPVRTIGFRNPIFVYHCSEDRVVPVEESKKFQRAAPRLVELEVWPGDHAAALRKGLPRVRDWLKRKFGLAPRRGDG